MDRTTGAERAAPARQPESKPEEGRTRAGKEKAKTASTRELGLDLSLIVANYLFKTEHLHYGYWTDDLPLEMSNLRRAQENYADFLLGHIPEGVRTILDVGMGTGALARRLVAAGYQVDCVSPSPNLTKRAHMLLGEEQTIYECRYEDLTTEKRYDLILFSESFQYINLEAALSVSHQHLNNEGYLLICDFFRKETPDPGPFGGGHSLKEFRRQIALYPLRDLVDKDITAQTAPNLDLVADFVEKVAAPMKEQVFGFLGSRYPLPFRALRWMFQRPLARAEDKYFTGKRTGANFQIYKSYRLLLFQQCSGTAS